MADRLLPPCAFWSAVLRLAVIASLGHIAEAACSESIGRACEARCESETFDVVNPDCPGLIIVPVGRSEEKEDIEVLDSNLRANFQIKQLSKTQSGGCEYRPVCSDRVDPALAAACIAKVEDVLKVETVAFIWPLAENQENARGLRPSHGSLELHFCPARLSGG